MQPDHTMFLTPIFQWGFAGLSAVLLAIIVWLIRRLLDLLEKTNGIIAENTAGMREVRGLTTDELRLMRELNNQLLARPCIAQFRVTPMPEEV